MVWTLSSSNKKNRQTRNQRYPTSVPVDHVFSGPAVVSVLLDIPLAAHLKAADIIHDSICTTNFFPFSYFFLFYLFLKKKKKINCFLAWRCKFHIVGALEFSFLRKGLSLLGGFTVFS